MQVPVPRANEIKIGSDTCVIVHYNQRYIRGLRSAPVYLRGLRIVCGINFGVVKKRKQQQQQNQNCVFCKV